MTALAGQKTFQNLIDEIGQECLRTSSASTTTQVMDPPIATIKQLINDAQRAIASEYRWVWAWKIFPALSTVIGQTSSYALDDTCEEVETMAIPASQTRLGQAAWRDWVRIYPGRYTNVGNTRPWMYVPDADASNNAKKMFLFPAADQIYSVEYAGRVRVVDMTANSDVPLIPPEYQDVLASRAKFLVFRYLGDARMSLWDHNNPDSDASKRYEKMWMENENKPDMVERFRSQEYEYAYTAFLDVNRMLFIGG